MSTLLLIFTTFILTVFSYITFLLRKPVNKEIFVGHRLMIGLGLWSLLTVIMLFFIPKMLTLTIFIDAMKHAMILLFLHSVILESKNVMLWLRPTIIALSLILASTIFLPTWGISSVGAYSFFGVVIILLQIVLVERFYQISKIHARAYHSLVFVLAAMSLIDFALYCEITLTQAITIHQFEWRSVAILISLPFLWKGLNALQKSPIKLEISKPLAFHGVIFLMSAAYLLGISFVSYLIQRFDINVNYTTQLVLCGFAIVPLLLALSSKRIRKEVMVWINKHLFAAQFDYRATWLNLIEKLNPDLSGQSAYDQGLSTVIDAIKHESGAYYEVSDSGVINKLSSINIEMTEDSENTISSMIDYLREINWVVDVPEATAKPDHYPSLKLCTKSLDENNIRWVVPITRDGILKGLLIVGKTVHKDWDLNWETRDFLLALGHQLERYVFSQHTQKRLSEHAQLVAFHQTSAFVIHDLKNVHQQMKMLLKNGEKHRENPAFINDLFVTLGSVEKRVNKTLSQLTNKQNKITNDFSREIEIAHFIRSIVSSKEMMESTFPPSYVPSDNDEIAKIEVNVDRFTNVIKHLIDNARHACKKTLCPIISIGCKVSLKHVKIIVSDNGIGMSEDFINYKLFHPFETTKGNSGMGLGVYDAKTFAENHGGHISVKSTEGNGSQFTISLPRSGA